MKVRWAWRADADLDDVVLYVARDDIDAAIRLEDRILAATRDLEIFPNLGRVGRRPDTRELVIVGTPYFAVYAIDRDTVVILHIVHGARDWPPSDA